MIPRLINAILGGWLAISPMVFGLGPGSPAGRNDFAVGITVMAAAVAAIMYPKLRVLNGLLGAWIVIAPLAKGYPPGGHVLNEVLVGTLILALSLAPGSGHLRDHRVLHGVPIHP